MARAVDSARRRIGFLIVGGHDVPRTVIDETLAATWALFASERLTGALLDRIAHHVHILEMNADSYRLKQSRSRRQRCDFTPPRRHIIAPPLTVSS